jgi:alkaline phosphatase D
MPTILQLSDAHLSPRTTLFRGNVELVRRAVADAAPDLVVATGDLSLDGADRDPDLAMAAEWHRGFPGPLMALPGNHDVGSDVRLMATQPVDDARLDRWRRHLGPGRGVTDLPGWRVIGLNSEVMGTGHAEEAAQAAFLRDSLAGLGERRIALFLHRPPYLESPDENWGMWAVGPEGRAALSPVLDHPALRLVASGHIHLHHEVTRGPARHVWAPALSFYCSPDFQAGLPGSRRPGALLHRLHADHVETTFLAPEGLTAVDIAEVQDQTYPRS